MIDNKRAIAAFNEKAAAMFEKFESFDAAAIHPSLFKQLPADQLRVLDIGAGSGRDAAYLQSQGHVVTAVEPATGLLQLGQQKYPQLDWRQDTLPELETLAGPYDLVMCINVLMFLSPANLQSALHRLLALTTPQGLIFLSLRVGPPDNGIVRAEVAEEELAVLTRAAALVVRDEMPDPQERPGVRFLKLLFRKQA